MIVTIPRITQEFIVDQERRAGRGSYNVMVDGIDIKIFPYVFPPISPFSESSHTVYDGFGDLSGKIVLDIGAGTGIQAIKAVLAGAKEVDAVDIYGPAVECSKYNARLNEVNVNVWESDLFDNIPKKQYDLIIANLPIVDYPEQEIRLHSLFDPGFEYHKRFFKEAKEYLTKKGIITLTHADLQGRETFDNLEQLAEKNGLNWRIDDLIEALGHEWRRYIFCKKNENN